MTPVNASASTLFSVIASLVPKKVDTSAKEEKIFTASARAMSTASVASGAGSLSSHASQAKVSASARAFAEEEGYEIVDADCDLGSLSFVELAPVSAPEDKDAGLISALRDDPAIFVDIDAAKKNDVPFICRALQAVPGLYFCLEDAMRENEEVLIALIAKHPAFIKNLPKPVSTDRYLLGLLRKNPSLSLALSDRFPPDMPFMISIKFIVETDQFLDWCIWLGAEPIPPTVYATRDRIIRALENLPLEHLRKDVLFALGSRKHFSTFCYYLQMEMGNGPEAFYELAARSKILLEKPVAEGPLNCLQRSLKQLKELCAITCYPLETLLLNIHSEYSPDQIFGESIPFQMKKIILDHFRAHHLGKPSGNQLVKAFLAQQIVRT